MIRSADLNTPPIDFRQLLQQELLRRCKANPRYSVRAFARMLEIDHSTLSQFMRGKRKISKKIQLRLGARLNVSPDELMRMGNTSEDPVDLTRDAYHFTLDSFKVVADWYHYAIFELLTVKDFNSDARWIAKQLSISPSEVHIALERLERLRVIKKTKGGKWVQAVPFISTTQNNFTAVAFRKLQAQVLEKALHALEEVPMEFRDQSSVTMAIDSKRLPEVKQRIKKFRRDLCALLQSDGSRDSVYQLGVSFYPLTAVMKKEGGKKV